MGSTSVRRREDRPRGLWQQQGGYEIPAQNAVGRVLQKGEAIRCHLDRDRHDPDHAGVKPDPEVR